MVVRRQQKCVVGDADGQIQCGRPCGNSGGSQKTATSAAADTLRVVARDTRWLLVNIELGLQPFPGGVGHRRKG
jgi:hypothetical protein